MLCPVDGATLLTTERSGVEIDHCPTCRGVWLDRGELEKILAGASAAPSAMPDAAPVVLPEPGAAEPSRVPHGDDRRAYGDKLDEWRARDEAAARSRPRGFLEDLFDF